MCINNDVTYPDCKFSSSTKSYKTLYSKTYRLPIARFVGEKMFSPVRRKCSCKKRNGDVISTDEDCNKWLTKNWQPFPEGSGSSLPVIDFKYSFRKKMFYKIVRTLQKNCYENNSWITLRAIGIHPLLHLF